MNIGEITHITPLIREFYHNGDSNEIKIKTFTLSVMPSVHLTLRLTKGIIITTLGFLSLLSKAAALVSLK